MHTYTVRSVARVIAQGICHGITRTLTLLIIGIRPLLGPATCKFPVGCTSFAVEALKTMPLLGAIQSILRRVVSCRPF